MFAYLPCRPASLTPVAAPAASAYSTPFRSENCRSILPAYAVPRPTFRPVRITSDSHQPGSAQPCRGPSDAIGKRAVSIHHVGILKHGRGDFPLGHHMLAF